MRVFRAQWGGQNNSHDNLTTRENLRLTARFFFKNNKKAIEKRIDEVIELTGLSQVSDRRVKGFSGGERQRLGIAQAQINFPELLILDEPTAALDPIGRKKVLDVMDNLKDRTTIFYSTHILSDVQRVSDMVAILDGGVCIAQGNIEELMTKNSGPVYTVTGRGNLKGSVEMLSALPWVSDVICNYHQPTGYTGMNIEVADSKIAPWFPNSMLSGDEDAGSVIGNYFFNGTVSSYESLITAAVLAVCFLLIAVWRFNAEEI